MEGLMNTEFRAKRIRYTERPMAVMIAYDSEVRYLCVDDDKGKLEFVTTLLSDLDDRDTPWDQRADPGHVIMQTMCSLHNTNFMMLAIKYKIADEWHEANIPVRTNEEKLVLFDLIKTGSLGEKIRFFRETPWTELEVPRAHEHTCCFIPFYFTVAHVPATDRSLVEATMSKLVPTAIAKAIAAQI